MIAGRSVRIFLSSTFRDFGEERDLLVRQVFPALRARLKDRFVELVDVDLRWGITVEQAERGEVLPICLAEIDRARPYFVGMLGERYGWIPAADAFTADLLEGQPWLSQYQGGKSVTELEILHGVLNNPQMAGRAFFYFRSRAYARRQGGEYIARSREDRDRQDMLKSKIRESGYPVVGYRTPQALAKRLERDLWALLNTEFPARKIPDAFERDSWRHESYAAPRRRLYLGAHRHLAALDAALERGEQRVLIEGASGIGKSALLANWLAQRRLRQTDTVFEHYLAASTDAADPQALVRRLLEFIRRTLGTTEEIPDSPQQMFDALPSWLAQVGQHARRSGRRMLLAIDAINGLTSLGDLRWFPGELPPGVHVFVSCLPGGVHAALIRKGPWHAVQVTPLDESDQRTLLTAYLARYNKVLPEALSDRVLAHPLSGNPLFLRTLAEELRVFGVHEQLAQRLEVYLSSRTVEDLFLHVLHRIAQDFPAAGVESVMTALWASRSGLREEEILGLSGLVHATWAPLRAALDEMLLDAAGLVTFAHDYIRRAVGSRYLQTQPARLSAHVRLAGWFREQPVDARRAHEEPFQWQRSLQWESLRRCLVDPEMFRAVHRHSGQHELLGFWLRLESEYGVSLARAYQEAMQTHWRGESDEAMFEGLRRLQRFLAYAGNTGSFAVEVSARAVELATQRHEPHHRNRLETLNRSAMLRKARSEFALAEPLYREVLASLEQLGRKGREDLGTVLINLAELFRAQGQLQVAEEHARRALAVQEQVKGSHHMATWLALNNLASILRERGSYAEAVELHTRALRIVRRRRGFEHRDTSVSLNNLGVLFQRLRRDAEAERAHRAALKIREKVLGPDHPMTATSRNNLAMSLRTSKRFDEAETLYREVLSSLERSLVPGHVNIGTCLHNIGTLLLDTGRAVEARAPLERALQIREDRLGRHHRDVANTLNALARLALHEGRSSEAIAMRERALSILSSALGDQHPETKTTRQRLAQLYRHAGRMADAERLSGGSADASDVSS